MHGMKYASHSSGKPHLMFTLFFGQKHLKSRKSQCSEQNVPCKQDLRSPEHLADHVCPSEVTRFRKKEKNRMPS